MAEIVNLKRFAKNCQRAEKDRKAAENRVRFGRAKAERTAVKAEAAREAKSLDAKKLSSDIPPSNPTAGGTTAGSKGD